MKKVSKLVAMLMVLVMTLSLTACGGNAGKDLIGTWSMSCDLSDMMAEQMGSEFADFDSSFVITLKFAFNEDGTCKVYVDEEELGGTLDTWMNDLIAYAVDMTYDMFEEQGIDRETADGMIQEQYGTTMEEVLRQQMEGSIDASDLAASVEVNGVYEVKGNKLYMSEGSEINKNEYDLFKISGDTLTLELADGVEAEEIIPGMSYPLTLTREK